MIQFGERTNESRRVVQVMISSGCESWLLILDDSEPRAPTGAEADALEHLQVGYGIHTSITFCCRCQPPAACRRRAAMA